MLNFFTIRRGIVLIVLSVLLFYYAPNLIVGHMVLEITGSPVKANVSLLELLRGNIKFSKLTVFSPTNYGSAKAIVLNDLKINLNLMTLFNSQKIIEEICVSETDLNSIYHDGSNNINDLINNSMSYFAKKGEQGSGSYIIKELFLRNIHLNLNYS